MAITAPGTAFFPLTAFLKYSFSASQPQRLKSESSLASTGKFAQKSVHHAQFFMRFNESLSITKDGKLRFEELLKLGPRIQYLMKDRA